MWVGAFKKAFQLVDLKKNFFSLAWTAWVGREKKVPTTAFLFYWEADGQLFGNVWSVLCHIDGRGVRSAQSCPRAGGRGGRR